MPRLDLDCRRHRGHTRQADERSRESRDRSEGEAMTDADATPLLEVTGLGVSFGDGAEPVPAVRDAGFRVLPGQRIALVGESGSGKSTVAHAVMGLLPGSGRVTGGRISLRGEDITGAGEKRLRRLRGREIGLV